MLLLLTILKSLYPTNQLVYLEKMTSVQRRGHFPWNYAFEVSTGLSYHQSDNREKKGYKNPLRSNVSPTRPSKAPKIDAI